MRINPILSIIVGYTGTGKTTYIEKMIAKNKRSLVITPHISEWNQHETIDLRDKNYYKYQGTRRVDANRKIMQSVNRSPDFFRNGLLVLDDSRSYVKPKIDEDVEDIIIARKQRGLDVVVAAHALTLVPRMFFSFASHFIMFKTQDNIIGRKDVINPAWYAEISEMQRRVNEHKDFHYYEIFKTQNT